MANGRDDFTEKTKKTMQQRAGNRCSNPDCRCLTSGPNIHPEKATSIGVAAHITAASPNGPRYDPILTADERKSILNGIWLCHNCAKLIDSDPMLYTESLLHRWKSYSEELARLELEGKELKPEQQYEGYFCPHCETFAKKGVTVCLGCNADIYYGSTPSAWKQDVQSGATTTAGIIIVFFLLLPEVVGNILGVSVPVLWGANFFAVLIGAVAASVLAGQWFAHKNDRFRKEQPPLFVRRRH